MSSLAVKRFLCKKGVRPFRVISLGSNDGWFSSVALQRPDPELVDASSAPVDFAGSAAVYRDFVSEQESEILLTDLQAKLKRRRYEKGHWDAVIIKYKETELFDESSLSTDSQSVLDRVREQLLHCHFDDDRKEQVTWLPCHAIDLHPAGELNAHVDSVRFSGDVVAGLSLMSPCIMRLKPEDNKASGHVDLYLPPLSLYVLSGPSRYSYTHELLPTGDSFGGVAVERDHRLSIIFRDAKVEDE